MDEITVSRIFEETAYIRMGGTEEELRAAKYLAAECERFGCEAKLESFQVDMATIKTASLVVDG